MALASKADARFGRMLVEEGLLSEEEIEQALNERKKRGLANRPFGRYLVEGGYVKEAEALRVLGRQFNLAVIDLQEVELQPEAGDKVSEEICRKYGLIPLF